MDLKTARTVPNATTRALEWGGAGSSWLRLFGFVRIPAQDFAVQWRLQVLHDPGYHLPWELCCYHILRPCGIFSRINSVYLKSRREASEETTRVRGLGFLHRYVGSRFCVELWYRLLQLDLSMILVTTPASTLPRPNYDSALAC